MLVLLLVSIDLSEQLHIVGWSGGYAVTWDRIRADHCQPVSVIVIGKCTQPTKQEDMQLHRLGNKCLFCEIFRIRCIS